MVKVKLKDLVEKVVELYLDKGSIKEEVTKEILSKSSIEKDELLISKTGVGIEKAVWEEIIEVPRCLTFYITKDRKEWGLKGHQNIYELQATIESVYQQKGLKVLVLKDLQKVNYEIHKIDDLQKQDKIIVNPSPSGLFLNFYEV